MLLPIHVEYTCRMQKTPTLDNIEEKYLHSLHVLDK